MNPVFVITGATSGLGREAALALAARGFDLALVGRDPQKGTDLVQSLQARRPDRSYRFFAADLSLVRENRRVAAEIRAAIPRLDGLLNNVGGYFETRQVTAEGFEHTWALNHLSYFTMTEELLPALKSPGQARIVNVSSLAHTGGKIHWDDLQGEKRFSGWGAYAQSKLANLLFTFALARRLEGTGVTANALHPGFVGTSFGDSNGQTWFGRLFRWAKRFALSPEEGAATSVFLCADPSVAEQSGGYYEKSRRAKAAAAALRVEDQERLWSLTQDQVSAGRQPSPPAL